jgi:hypothetical protein
MTLFVLRLWFGQLYSPTMGSAILCLAPGGVEGVVVAVALPASTHAVNLTKELLQISRQSLVATAS